MYSFGGLHVRRLDEAEHFAGLVVEPVAQVLHAVLPLRFEILGVRDPDSVFPQPRDVTVNVHVKRHGSLLRKATRRRARPTCSSSRTFRRNCAPTARCESSSRRSATVRTRSLRELASSGSHGTRAGV